MIPIHTLKGHLTQREALEYSLFKLGDKKILHDRTTELVALMRRHMTPGEQYVVYATNRYPRRNRTCKKGSFLLAEGAARLLTIPIVVGKYKYTLRKGVPFRHAPITRREYLSRETTVFVVDDAYFKGEALRFALSGIKVPVKRMIFFGILHGKNKSKELPLNDLAFRKGSVSRLAAIITQKGYIFTNQMLKTLDKLPQKEMKILRERMGPLLRRKLSKAIKIHHGTY